MAGGGAAEGPSGEPGLDELTDREMAVFQMLGQGRPTEEIAEHSGLTEEKVIEAIDPKKYVDAFHPVNVGRTVIGLPSFISATPYGIVELLKRYDIETSGKNCVVVGRSNIVGRPMSILMSQKAMNATVTVAHSRTANLEQLCASADILIAALGAGGQMSLHQPGPARDHTLRMLAGQGAEGASRRGSDTVRAQIPGRVVRLWVSDGDTVETGQRLLAIEAMKMENEVRAPHAGTVERVHVSVDGSVELNDELITLR